MPRRRTVIQDLRHAVDGLPLPTREAMLEGVRAETIIVGAYTDRRGGVCPMLAAHRHGGRTSFLAFARTWDRFTRAPKRGSRPATARELRILERHLVASIAAERAGEDELPLAAAIADHRRLVAARPVAPPEAAPVPARRRPRLRHRLPAWMRPLRSVAEYEAAMADADAGVRLGLVGDTAGPADATSASPRARAGATR